MSNQMLKMAQDLPLARIHGWLAGDGHADARVEPDKHGVHYELRFFPDSKKLAGLFALNFRKQLRVRPHIHDTRGTEECYAVRVRNVAACRLILSVAPLGRHTWPIPSFGYEEEHVQWIKSYYDCEARVYGPQHAIQAKSVNNEGLEQVRMRLGQIGVRSNLHGPYHQKKETWAPYWVLSITGRSEARSHALKVGFNHPAKLRALMSI